MKRPTHSQQSTILQAACLSLACFIAVPGAFAVPVNSLDAYVSDSVNVVDPINQSLTSNTGAVNYDASTGSCPTTLSGGSSYANCGKVAGSADFGVVKAQALASSSGDLFYRIASSTADTSYQVTIGAAPAGPGISGSGLSLGDSVSLNLSFRLDGILNSGASAGDTTGSVDMSSKLRIMDPGIELDCGSPDGCYTPKLLEFRSDASSTTYGSSGETFNNWNWDLTTRDALDTVIDAQSGSDSWVMGPGSTCLSSPCNDIDFDTGVLSTLIETTVGATLDIYGSLDIFSQAWDFGGNGAYGSGDFMDTFGLVFTPVTEGVELSYGGITPASYDLGGSTTSVPEPATLVLMMAGLAGLGFARNKRA